MKAPIKIYKLFEEENQAMIGRDSRSNSWYCWNGKDIAKLFEDGSRIRPVQEVRDAALKLYETPVDKPSDYVDEVNKTIRGETQYIMNKIKNIQENQNESDGI